MEIVNGLIVMEADDARHNVAESENLGLVAWGTYEDMGFLS